MKPKEKKKYSNVKNKKSEIPKRTEDWELGL